MQVYGELFSDGTPERLQDIFNALEHEAPGQHELCAKLLRFNLRLTLF